MVALQNSVLPKQGSLIKYCVAQPRGPLRLVDPENPENENLLPSEGGNKNMITLMKTNNT